MCAKLPAPAVNLHAAIVLDAEDVNALRPSGCYSWGAATFHAQWPPLHLGTCKLVL